MPKNGSHLQMTQQRRRFIYHGLQDNNMSVRALSERIGVSITSVYAWLNGANATKGNMEAIKRVLIKNPVLVKPLEPLRMRLTLPTDTAPEPRVEPVVTATHPLLKGLSPEDVQAMEKVSNTLRVRAELLS